MVEIKKEYFVIAVLAFVVSGCARGGVAPVAENKVDPNVIYATSTDGVVASSTDENLKKWIPFDSKKDAGLNIGFAFDYPGAWKQEGSVDGGQFSVVPFFKKAAYAKNCEGKKGSEFCKRTGKIAEVSINGSEEALNNSHNFDGKDFKSDHTEGYISITNVKKTPAEIANPFVKNKIIVYTIPKIKGVNFKFSMAIESKYDEEVFYKIIENIDFK
ncbi:hypothetical protein HGA64_04560 [Candidatus Falkowbacteria bacterium]|nr:hypothetical protein [Candidatus Falkowbacteria bacterium]